MPRPWPQSLLDLTFDDLSRDELLALAKQLSVHTENFIIWAVWAVACQRAGDIHDELLAHYAKEAEALKTSREGRTAKIRSKAAAEYRKLEQGRKKIEARQRRQNKRVTEIHAVMREDFARG